MEAQMLVFEVLKKKKKKKKLIHFSFPFFIFYLFAQ